MTLNLLSLNRDVLYIVLSYLNASSALTLSMVSREAYDISLARSLSSVYITQSQDQLRAFCMAMLMNGGVRLPFLRELTIISSAFGVARHIEFTHTVDFSASSQLVDLLEGARRLRRLSISCFEALITHEPRIAAALQALPDLVDVSLHNCGELSLTHLPQMCSQLRRLTFTQLFNKKTPALFERLGALQNLDCLELAHLDIQTDKAWPPTDSGMAERKKGQIAQIPSLRTLSVHGTKARMSSFVNAFPNLHTLIVSDIYADPVEGDNDTGNFEACWPSLDRLRGNVPDFAHWVIACPVRLLELEQTSYHYATALGVIERTNPIILSLPVETRVSQAAFWGRFVRVVPRLRHLALRLDEGHTMKVDDWMGTIPQILGTIPIQSLSICIRPFRVPSPTLNPVRHVAGPVPTSDTLTESVLHAFRLHIACTIASLRWVAVTVAEKGKFSVGDTPAVINAEVPLWWRVDGGALEPILKCQDFNPIDAKESTDTVRPYLCLPRTRYKLKIEACVSVAVDSKAIEERGDCPP
ncbi:hypothetical protein BKA93DRAFT_584407 [Sparassis latifolia]|uniref:F-box domain-containing protein n=1 Tax=Sparassis crispa TaxID=139825 RepID=A0A401H012_9APHY|nr:predicted protein [Sparassis crispa]GBE87719.1 predicted protein [Sparassis crispa]